jgi:hypothetical protein
MSGLLVLVEALARELLLGILRWNSDTTCKYYTRYVYVKVMAGMSESSSNNATPVRSNYDRRLSRFYFFLTCGSTVDFRCISLIRALRLSGT